MLVLKFGGASLKSAAAIKNIKRIIDLYPVPKVIVVSAMGKMTNRFEDLLHAYHSKQENQEAILKDIIHFHYHIAESLFESKSEDVFGILDGLFKEVEGLLQGELAESYDESYDQLVSYGELLSSRIISEYLKHIDVQNQWMDARSLIITNDCFRDAYPDFKLSEALCLKAFNFSETKTFLTQGFIGGTKEGKPTTLGREGSDYSGAILSYLLDADSFIVWKDVPGFLNADPRYFTNTKVLESISFREAVELAYYGAKIVHPKTIKPLQNKNIPMYVKSFLDPGEQGTSICAIEGDLKLPPIYILKRDQVLISISPLDFSFILENNLSDIFGIIAEHKVKVNLMQNSAISFSVCLDNNPKRIGILMDSLKLKYRVLFNEGLDLVTIRHYNKDCIEFFTKDRKLFLTQKSRNTARLLMKSNGKSSIDLP